MQINEIYRDIVVVLCLNYSKDIKGLKYIIVTLLTLFWIFYATPAILLRIPYVQQKVATTATRELSVIAMMSSFCTVMNLMCYFLILAVIRLDIHLQQECVKLE